MTPKQRALLKSSAAIGGFVAFVALYAAAPVIGVSIFLGALAVWLFYCIYNLFLVYEERNERERKWK